MDTLKVPKEAFEAAIRALLSTPPSKSSDISPKQKPKTEAKRKTKKRG